MFERDNLSIFPGGDLIQVGLTDLAKHIYSEEALLVLIAGPRLRHLDFPVEEPPEIPLPYEHRLYEAIEARNPAGAHAEYNALNARIVSFANAYSRIATP